MVKAAPEKTHGLEVLEHEAIAEVRLLYAHGI